MTWVLAECAVVALLLCGVLGMASTASAQTAEQPPRKVVVATFKSHISGSKQQRLEKVLQLLESAGAEAQKKLGQPRLDLMVLPEFAILEGRGNKAAEQAVAQDDPAVAAVAALARKFNSYVVLPVVLKESDGGAVAYANAALLLDRGGKVAGIYRKAYPIVTGPGEFEGGVTPGAEFPVFACDFGKLGIQICWDMSYEQGWQTLAERGAEIVALPSASPQTIRPAACAQRFRYWVVSATPRDNATIYDPIGMVSARTETDEVLVHQIDLSSAMVHWNPIIENGQAFARAFGERGGFTWSTREDTGLFWSNDPAMPVAEMLRQLKVEQMDVQVKRIGQAVRGAGGK